MKFWDLFQPDNGQEAALLNHEFQQVEHLMLELFGQRRRLYACDCVERVLPIFERPSPDDDRPRNAIMVARRFAFGIASSVELDAAYAAVLAAREDALSQSPAHFHGGWPPVSVAEAACMSAIPDVADLNLVGVSRSVLKAVAATSDRILKEKQWQYQRLRWYLKKTP
jgi:hypothetical protein